ncbi:MAG TPA: hypothetical protein VFU27_15070 [Terriglobales bacterium]|nr:hypothetical protein [Terriglobales bacterium]
MRLVMFCILCLLAVQCGAQGAPKGYDGPIPMAGGRRPEFPQAGPHEHAARKIDVAQLQSQADELAKLAAEVPPDVEQLKKGLLSKDLKHNLKRIEKLSKRLQRELNE